MLKRMMLFFVLCGIWFQAYAVETEIFSDTFDTGFAAWEAHLKPDPTGWTTTDTETNNAACYDGSGHMQLAATDPQLPEIANYRFEAGMKFLGTQNFPGGVRFGADPTTGNSWALWAYPASGMLYLYKVSAWNIDTPPLTTLSVAHNVDMSMTDASGSPIYHSIVIEVIGTMATITWDGATVITHDLGITPMGTVALDVSSRPVCFDDVVFTQIDGPVPPPPVDPTIRQLFSDDFSGTLDAWLQSPLTGGIFSLTVDETLLFDGGGHTQLYIRGLVCSDCTATVDVTLQTDVNYPGGIRFRMDETTGNGYAAWLYPTSGMVKLYRVDGGWHIDTNLTHLGQVSVPLQSGTPFEFGVRGVGNTIEVLLDGEVVLSVVDSTYTEGTVALDPSNQPIEYDNVRVTEKITFAFIDLFDDPAFNPFDPAMWYESPLGDGQFSGWSRTADGYAAYSGGTHKQVATVWDGTDYRLDTLVRLPTTGSFPGGPCVRVDQTSGKRYCTWIYPTTGEIKLLEVYGWHVDLDGYTVIGTASIGQILSGIDYPLSIEATANTIRVWFNDVSFGTPLIESTSTLANRGGVGFDVSGSPVQYAEVFVTGTTAPAVPPVAYGSGGRILALYSEDDPSGQYVKAILEGEGLTGYSVRRIDTVNATNLATHELVIVGEMTLTAEEAAMLVAYVQAGGNLLTMRPDPVLYGILGVTSAGSSTSEGYYLVDQLGVGAGITDTVLQFHGTADHVVIGPNVSEVAALYAGRTTPTGYPAATMRYLPQGGSAGAFWFNMPLSVVYTRQGNPAWVNQDRDCEINPVSCLLRSDDLFYGAATFDPQPDYVDFANISIPQADELQRLFANMVYDATSVPLPRNWYLPNALMAAIIDTGDDHGSGGTVQRFEEYLQLSPPGCVVADWQCYRMTSYFYNGVLTQAQADQYRTDGFEPALHVTTNGANYTEGQLRAFMSDQRGIWATIYGQDTMPETNRTHAIAWSGWGITPRVSLDFGIRLDTNYYWWPPEWGIADVPGHMTGSGLPQEFAEIDGRPIAVYQAHTHLTDETATSGILVELHIESLLGWAEQFDYPTVVTTNLHTDRASHFGTLPLVNAAQFYDVPIITAKQMLDWLDGRNATVYQNVSWDGTTLSYTAQVHHLARNLQTMIPLQNVGAIPTVSLNGQTVPYEFFMFKGITYVRFFAESGTYNVTNL